MIYDFQKILSFRLLFWAGVSLLIGILLWLTGSSFWRGFGLQAVIWGTIDAIIALLGLRAPGKKLSAPFDRDETAKRTHWLRRVLAVNAGLDVLYMAVGIALVYLPGRSQPFTAGMGWGIVVQGAFLFAFDSLHAWRIPAEIFLPDWGLFQGAEHRSFERNGGRPAALFIHGFPDTPFAISDLAESLHVQGWTVSGLLLPGLGPQLNALYQQRAEFWIDAICREIDRLKKEHNPVIVVGFSLGGGLAVPATGRTQPHGLVLLAPFCLPYPAWLSAAFTLARIFLPYSVRVGPYIKLETAEIQQGFAMLLPDLSINDPMVRETLRQLRIPFIFVEQFLRLSRFAHQGAQHWRGPTLVIQGAGDGIVRPAWSRQLAQRLGSQAEWILVPGNHNLNLPGHVSFPQVTDRLARFASSILRE